MLKQLWTNPYSHFSLRLSSGLALWLAASWAFGVLEQGIIACLIMPALLIGGIDIPSPNWSRRIIAAVVSFGAFAGVTAELSLLSPQWLTLWFTSIGFLLTSCGAFGILSARLSMGVLTMAVIGMATAGVYPTWQLAAGFALATAWMTGFSAFWYRVTGHMPLRQSLAATYRRLAQLLIERPEQLLDHKLPVHFDEQLGVELANCRRLLSSLGDANDKGPLKNAFMAAVDLQERLQAVPEPVLTSQVLTSDGSFPIYKQWTRAVAARLHRIARDLERGRNPQRTDSLDSYTDALVVELTRKQQAGGRLAMVANYMINNARQIDRLVSRAAPLYQRVVAAPPSYSPWQQWRQAMHWDNPVMRGSVRMALLLAVASEIASLMPLDNGFWILSTVVVVWQASFVAIRSRAWQRAAGTFGGLAIAFVLFALGLNGMAALALALLLVPPTLALVTKHHGWTTVGVTLILMLAFDYYGMAGTDVILARMLDTVIGCVLVFGAYRYLWPQWQGGRQRQLRQQGVTVLSNYWRLILQGFAGEQVEPVLLARARRQAYEQGIAMNDSLNQMRQEPGFGHNVNNSATLLALYKGAMSHLNAIVPQLHKSGFTLCDEDSRQLKQLFDELESVLLATSQGDIQPWPERFLAAEQWLLQRLENSSADRSGFVLYQLSLLLQRCHGIHQILLMPAPKPKARLHS